MRPVLARTAMVSLLVGLAGCGGGEPDQRAGGSAGAGQNAASARNDASPRGASGGQTSGSGTVPAPGGAAQGTSPAAPTAGASAVPAGAIEVSFISADFIGAVVSHPRRVLDSQVYREISQWPEMQFDEFAEFTGVDPHDIEQIIMLFDKPAALGAAQLPFSARADFEERHPVEEYRLDEPSQFNDARRSAPPFDAPSDPPRVPESSQPERPGPEAARDALPEFSTEPRVPDRPEATDVRPPCTTGLARCQPPRMLAASWPSFRRPTQTPNSASPISPTQPVRGFSGTICTRSAWRCTTTMTSMTSFPMPTARRMGLGRV